MHTIILLEKYTLCKLITELENIAVRNEKKDSRNKVSYNYLESPVQTYHNSRRSQYLYEFFVLFY